MAGDCWTTSYYPDFPWKKYGYCEVFREVTMQQYVTAFREVMPCSLVEVHRCFGIICCFHFQGRKDWVKQQAINSLLLAQYMPSNMKIEAVYSSNRRQTPTVAHDIALPNSIRLLSWRANILCFEGCSTSSRSGVKYSYTWVRDRLSCLLWLSVDTGLIQSLYITVPSKCSYQGAEGRNYSTTQFCRIKGGRQARAVLCSGNPLGVTRGDGVASSGYTPSVCGCKRLQSQRHLVSSASFL
jgi:hypothetical protein